MCEINPTHKRFFLLEAFTSSPSMSEKEFVEEVSMIILKTEMELNKSSLFRFHIHEDTKRNKNG